MKDIRFTNPKTGVQYKRISKQKAKKLYMEGHSIIIAPCKMRLFTEWCGWHLISKKDESDHPEADFRITYNSFIYYNCNNETGRYPSFYVTENLA